MRTLTLGVLIVTTGTLAALPFRNRPPSGPGEQPTRSPVSGPSTDLVAETWPDRRSERLLEPAPLRPSPESLRETPTSARRFDRVTSSWNGATADHGGGRDRGLERLSEISQGSDALAESDPSDLTLKSESSYEDWMIPVDDSQLIRERFSATVSGLNRDGKGALGERRAAATPHSTDAVPASLREARRHDNGASLSTDERASDDVSTSETGPRGSPISSATSLLPRRPLGGLAPPTAERHWIRQPR